MEYAFINKHFVEELFHIYERNGFNGIEGAQII